MAEPRAGAVDEVALVRAVAAGSQDALAALYDRHAEAIFALALRTSDDRGVAEEVVQETFLALWNRAELFDPATGSLGTWLRSIARNRAIDRLRAAGRRPRFIPLVVEEGSEGGSAALERAAATGTVVGGAVPSPGPEATLSQVETREAIRGALATMPDVERLVIVLAYQDELSQSEIAERLGWPLGTVKTRTRRALRRLRFALGASLGPFDTADGPDALDDPKLAHGPHREGEG
jgi:RNA polymerase sigma-70 factor (ECF subfamily)